MSNYVRKTFDEYNIEGDYGYGQGFEVVNTEKTWPEAKRSVKEYRQNQQGIPFRITKKRVRILK